VTAAFLHPGLLWGLLLAGVPILIHILNRRRYRRKAWAAMEFLLAALEKTRRRMFLEEILLLLLRTAAAAALALLAARPLSSGPGLLASLAGEKGTHHVLILDDSASMGQSRGGRTLLSLAAGNALELARGLLERRKGDRITACISSHPDSPLLDGRPLTEETLDLLERELRDLEPTGLRLRPGSLLALLASRLADLAGPEERKVTLYLFSDFRKSDWEKPEGASLPDLRKALSALASAGTDLVLVPQEGSSAGGAGLVSLRPLGRLAAAGVPLEIRAEIRNQGTLPLGPLTPQVSMEGRVLPLKPIPSLPPGTKAALTFQALFSTPGDHSLAVTLPGDDLPADNTRFLALHVKESARVLLASPPSPPGRESQAFFLQAALAPGEVPAGFSTDTCTPQRAASRPLDPYDLVVLAGTAAPPPGLARHLADFVEKGGGLLLFGGPDLIPSAWNRTLGTLLPYPLGAPLTRPRTPLPGFLSDPAHPIWAKGKELFSRWLAQAAFTGYVRPGGPLRPGAEVPARLGGPEGPPLFAVIRKGRGRVLFSSVPADGTWSGWVGEPLFPLFLQEAAAWALPDPRHPEWNLDCGTPIRVPLDPETDSGRADITLPGAPGPRILQAETDRITWRDTSRPGIYTLMIHSSGAGPSRKILRALNVDPDECLLAQTTRSELETLYPSSRITWVPPAETGAWARSRKGDKTWRILAGVLLLLLLGETWLGRRSALRGGA